MYSDTTGFYLSKEAFSMKVYSELLTDWEVSPALSMLTDDRIPYFFDIETTDLSPTSGYCYLIGSLLKTPEGWLFRQWFAENADDEPAILNAFTETLCPEQILIHYNGSSFDIPFLGVRCRFHKLTNLLPGPKDTIDLFHKLSICRKLFALENRKQPTMEQLSGFKRTDQYDGGLLIPFYGEYVARYRFDAPRAEELLGYLLLHNHDDILGLATLPALIPYTRLSDITLSDIQSTVVDGSVILSARVPYCFPKSLRKVFPMPAVPEECVRCKSEEKDATSSATVPTNATISADATIASPESPEGVDSTIVEQYAGNCPDTCFSMISLTDDLVRITLPLYYAAPYFFFPNYKDYYYLPLEDKAIHKSLATFVDKAHRTPATKQTARQKHPGVFLPQLSELIAPAFRFQPNDELCFFEASAIENSVPEELLLGWLSLLTK